jgi:hypothetical protein
VEALAPAVSMHLALIGSPQDATEAARGIVDTHMEVSQRQIAAVAESDPEDYHRALDQTLARWESTRAEAVADSFTREEIAHVRSYQ